MDGQIALGSETATDSFLRFCSFGQLSNLHPIFRNRFTLRHLSSGAFGWHSASLRTGTCNPPRCDAAFEIGVLAIFHTIQNTGSHVSIF
jgi:hypothetical protein